MTVGRLFDPVLLGGRPAGFGELSRAVLQQAGQLVLKGQTPNWDELEHLMVQAVMALGLRPNRKRKPLVTKVKPACGALPPLPAGGP